MQRETKLRILEAVTPVFLFVGFVIKMVYNTAFAWWLDPWLRRKDDRALLDDITANLYFSLQSLLRASANI